MSLLILTAIIAGALITLFTQKWANDIRNKLAFQLNRLKNQINFWLSLIGLLILSSLGFCLAAALV
jgi:ABC-type uncharacterized transport system permease subunit